MELKVNYCSDIKIMKLAKENDCYSFKHSVSLNLEPMDEKKKTLPIAYYRYNSNMVYGMQEDANEFYIGLVNKLLNMLPD